ncbi:MAG TPA: LPXTG cell wall anchor domain-containing protein [Candidatus Saccharibacteria bacterium]|nr:LPXTG cell wall anchor domain-containing protein [Candidatus Saccharibacteria bacterium]HRK93940.1 LPXTG cell wall anchor domain-containing protein [Candidatus Saccharibacteria bacterium]
MRGKLVSFGVALLATATVGVVQLQTKAAVDKTRDCDQYAVINCGTLSASELRAEYSTNNGSGQNGTTTKQNDIKKIFNSMGISGGELSGFKNGVVYQDGRVIVAGKTVATGAMMAARGLGGTAIAGTGASRVSVSAMGSAQTALVKMNGDRFVFAVMKPCGNPVTATPPPQPPQPQPQPKAECKSLSASKIGSGTRYRLSAAASAKNGAKMRAYEFTVKRNGQQVFSDTKRTSELRANTAFSATQPGNYTARVIVKTSEGPKTGQQCVATFRVKKPENPPTPQELTPGIKVEKHVENVKYKRVGVNVEFSYQIKVTNTGEVDLKDVEVTDTPEDGITLLESQIVGTVENNQWTYTISELAVGESRDFTLQAKVPQFLAGRLTNTVCVDAPEVPGNPDDCDEAEVDVPPKGKVLVCEPESGDTISVDEKDADSYPPVGSPQCEEAPLENPKAAPPAELPQTGPAETVLSVIGAMSLAGASAYYFASRRHL